jgi:hypothetical protein
MNQEPCEPSFDVRTVAGILVSIGFAAGIAVLLWGIIALATGCRLPPLPCPECPVTVTPTPVVPGPTATPTPRPRPTPRPSIPPGSIEPCTTCDLTLRVCGILGPPPDGPPHDDIYKGPYAFTLGWDADGDGVMDLDYPVILGATRGNIQQWCETGGITQPCNQPDRDHRLVGFELGAYANFVWSIEQERLGRFPLEVPWECGELTNTMGRLPLGPEQPGECFEVRVEIRRDHVRYCTADLGWSRCRTLAGDGAEAGIWGVNAWSPGIPAHVPLDRRLDGTRHGMTVELLGQVMVGEQHELRRCP